MRASLDTPAVFSAMFLAVACASIAVAAAPSETPPSGTPAATTSTSTPPVPSAAVQTQRVDFNGSLRDIYSQYEWMVVQIDFVVRNNLNPEGNPRWAENLDVTLTMGWGTKSPIAPQVDLAMTSTVRLVGAEVGRVSTVFFFVPPEVIQRGIRRTPLNARALPSFYVVQYKIAGQSVKIVRADVSSSLPDAQWWDGFLQVAQPKFMAGWLQSEADVSPYVLSATLARLAPGNMVPSFIRNPVTLNAER